MSTTLGQIIYSRVASSGITGEDVMVNVIALDVFEMSATWPSDANLSDAEDAIAAWFDSIKNLLTSSLRLDAIRWNDLPQTGGSPSPQRRFTEFDVVGTGSSDFLPWQIACNVTWVTPNRRRWGRIYVPGFLESQNASGRVGSGTVDTLANASWTLSQDLSSIASGLSHVVVDRSSGISLEVAGVRVDDVWDIQRRRRDETPTYRKILP